MRVDRETKRAAWILAWFGVAIIAFSWFLGCGRSTVLGNPIPAPGPQPDNSVVRGIAVYTITSDQPDSITRFFRNLLNFNAYASTGSTTVTYNNAPSVTFTLNVASFSAGSITNSVLSLGSIAVSALNDNNLKVCNPGGNTKCTQALFRVYNTGTVAGFVNTSDSPQYGAPVYTSGQNPTTALVLNSPGVQVDSLTGIPTNKHTVKLSDFPSPTYTVTSDFSNAGSGSYSMTYVFEYALAP